MVYANYPTMTVSKKIFMGIKPETFTYTPQVGFMASRIPRTTLYDVFMFKIEGRDKLEEIKIDSANQFEYKEKFELILKIKKIKKECKHVRSMNGGCKKCGDPCY